MKIILYKDIDDELGYTIPHWYITLNISLHDPPIVHAMQIDAARVNMCPASSGWILDLIAVKAAFKRLN